LILRIGPRARKRYLARAGYRHFPFGMMKPAFACRARVTVSDPSGCRLSGSLSDLADSVQQSRCVQHSSLHKGYRMSSLEGTKILAAGLVALIAGMVANLVAEELVPSTKLDKNAFPIAGVGKGPSAKEAAAPTGGGKPAPLTAEMLAKADIAAGEAIAKKCATCHTFDKGDANRIGPNLYGVIDRPRGSIAGFAYSDAMKKLGGTWAPQEIAAFIADPKIYLPGTKMTFAGLPKPEDRANVLAFLNSKSDKPVDLAATQ
jgi:cytochrome c